MFSDFFSEILQDLLLHPRHLYLRNTKDVSHLRLRLVRKISQIDQPALFFIQICKQLSKQHMVQQFLFASLLIRKLIHQPYLLPLLLIDRLVQRFNIPAGVQSLRKLFLRHSQTFGDLQDRRLPPPLFLQPLLAEICFVGKLLKRSAYFDHPVVSQETFDLSCDHRNRIGREFHLVGEVELVDRL